MEVLGLLGYLKGDEHISQIALAIIRRTYPTYLRVNLLEPHIHT
jgi:hypothetical protein